MKRAFPGPSSTNDFIPIFWSALGGQLRYCGSTVNGWDDLVLKGEPENGKFSALLTGIIESAPFQKQRTTTTGVSEAGSSSPEPTVQVTVP